MFSARSSKPPPPGPPPRKPPSKTVSRAKLVVPPKAAASASQPSSSTSTPVAAASAAPGKYASWKQAFEAGVGSYKAGEYDAAVLAFDEATTLGGRKAIVLDSRAATLEKLGRVKEALMDAKALVELAPESHKGYVRGSHLSTLLTPPNFVRAHALLAHGLPLAPSHLQPTLQTRLDGLRISADGQSSRAARRQRNWTDGLPAELLVLVGEQAVLQDPDAVVRLAGVCVRWRDVAFSSPTLWARLRLGPKRPKAKLARFLDASNDRLSEVVVSAAASDVVAAIAPHLAGLASLDLAVPSSADLWDVLATLRYSLSSKLLRHLLIEGPSTVSPNRNVSWGDILDLVAGSASGAHAWPALETFSLTDITVSQATPLNAPVNETAPPGVYPQLRRLVLARVAFAWARAWPWGLHDLTSSMPRLEELSVTDDTHGLLAVASAPAPVDGDAPEPATFRLPRLKVLNYRQSTVEGLEDQRWDVRNLERLDLSRPRLATAQSALFASILFGPAQPAVQPNLTHLNLTRTPLDEPLLVDSLRRLPALVDLQVAVCNVSNALLVALTLAPADEAPGPADTCPRLEVLGLAHSDVITGGPLVRLVASRTAAPAQSSPSSPLPAGRATLRALNVDACPAVEDKALDWIRPRLETFSCKVPRAPKAGFAEKARRGF